MKAGTYGLFVVVEPEGKPWTWIFSRAVDGWGSLKYDANEDFSTLQTKAAVLTALARQPEADALMDHALELPGTGVLDVYFYGMSLLGAGQNGRLPCGLFLSRIEERARAEERSETQRQHLERKCGASPQLLPVPVCPVNPRATQAQSSPSQT